MKSTGNTVLITGGGSGIGLEIAKLFAEKGNKVIITGRSKEKLERAASQIGNIHFMPCDVSNEQEVDTLVRWVQANFKTLNILINNAGAVALNGIGTTPDYYTIAQKEIATNYLSVVNLTEKFLPLLKQQEAAAIVNVTSITALSPGLILSTYSASKAAVHSYTQGIRVSLAQSTAIKVFELIPSVTDTDFAKILDTDVRMSPSYVAEEFLKGFEKDESEIRVGQTEAIYQLSLQSPQKALLALNGLPF